MNRILIAYYSHRCENYVSKKTGNMEMGAQKLP